MDAKLNDGNSAARACRLSPHCAALAQTAMKGRAYLCIMAWRSRSAAPEELPPGLEAMVGEWRVVGTLSTLSVESVGITLDDLMRR